MPDHRQTPTSVLVRLIASGAPSPDDHEEAAAELDRRVKPPLHCVFSPGLGYSEQGGRSCQHCGLCFYVHPWIY